MIFQLDENTISFPNPSFGEPDGLLAVGGDLSVERLLLAYSYGIFPWFSFKDDPIMWWCPMERFVIFPKEIHVSHSMKQLIRSGRYQVTLNQAFNQVIRNCSRANERNEQDGAWLGEDMIAAYTELFRRHLAASVEVWDSHSGQLVGGLYGVNIGCNFFGESMFSLVPSASKLALIKLAEILADTGGIIDCQFETSHLRSMGGRHISYDEYMEYLRQEP